MEDSGRSFNHLFRTPYNKQMQPTNFPLRSKFALICGVDMASCCQQGESVPAYRPGAFHRSMSEAAGSSVTTVDQADMRALDSRKTVVRHGAASL